MLLWAKARISARDSRLQTPLWWAIAEDHEAVVRLLLQSEKSLAVMTNLEQLTPLHEAARLGSARMVKLLLPAYGASSHGSGRLRKARPRVDVRGGKGLQTPLHLACGRRHLEASAFLLTAGADPQVACSLGRTALHYACAGEASHRSGGENGVLELCHLLLRHRPMVRKLRDSSGRTAAELAGVGGHLTQELKLLLSSETRVWDSSLPMPVLSSSSTEAPRSTPARRRLRTSSASTRAGRAAENNAPRAQSQGASWRTSLMAPAARVAERGR